MLHQTNYILKVLFLVELKVQSVDIEKPKALNRSLCHNCTLPSFSKITILIHIVGTGF